MSIAKAIIEAINTTATRRFDTLDMPLPPDEYAALVEEMLREHHERKVPDTGQRFQWPHHVSLQTSWGEVRCMEGGE